MRDLPPIDFDRMEREILEGTPLPPTPFHYPEPVAVHHTAVQIIAYGISRLTWKEAEKMGAAIQIKMQDGITLTAAIQAWAEEWESFK